jgi:hypothetical protein
MAKGASTLEGKMGRVAHVRTMLGKSESVGLTPSETIILRGEVASLAARIARANARIGRDAVSLSSFAKNAGATAVAV